MTNAEFINLHKEDDVCRLAFAKVPKGVDQKFCLQQIEGYQRARKKLPSWIQKQGVVFPPRLALEQCSSEETANYKRKIALHLFPDEKQRIRMVDITGGYGIDFCALAPLFRQAIYAERQAHLCNMAQQNFEVFGLTNAEIVCEEVKKESPLLQKTISFLFADPARRDEKGEKMVALADCSPDITEFLDVIDTHCAAAMFKLSPMLDIREVLKKIPNTSEIHVVSVDGECKELLVVIGGSGERIYHCVNLGANESHFSCLERELRNTETPQFIEEIKIGNYLFEPNASILKAGVQDLLCQRLGLKKIHPNSHLYIGTEQMNFPGRIFRITDVGGLSKQAVRQLLNDTEKANLTVRNFPCSVDELRRRLKIREGGDVYLFATTKHDGSHALLRCERCQPMSF